MKKVKFINLCIVGLFALCMMACNSLEGDAKKMAKLMCEAENSDSDALKEKADQFFEKCREKYDNDKYREQFESLITKELEKCEEKAEVSGQDEKAKETTKPVTDTKKWDDVLASYEKYIDQYIKLYKKAQAGDVSAITEYASMAEKATELAEKLQDAGDELTATQAAKFTKLQTKLAKALQ